MNCDFESEKTGVHAHFTSELESYIMYGARTEEYRTVFLDRGGYYYHMRTRRSS